MKNLLLLFTIALIAISNNSFSQCDNGRFVNDIFNVKSSVGVRFGGNYKFDGTWQELYMNVYEPDSTDLLPHRPLIILAFGGSFTFGSRTSPDILKLCNAFAKKGYVTATIDYRLGFENGNDSDTNQFKALMRAAQDMRASIRYFYKDASSDNIYRVDTTQIFIGGVSAGGFTALNLAYGKQDTLSIARPPFVDDALVQVGGVTGNSGNPGYSEKVRGVINLCGAIADTVWLMPNDPILCGVHGTADPLVPCFYDSAKAASSVEAMMYGSGDLNNRAQHIGLAHSFYFFQGASHVPFVFNQNYMDTTIWVIRDFLAQHVVCGGLNTINKANNFSVKVYPNPFYGNFIVETNNEKPITATLTDITGKTILFEKITDKKQFLIEREKGIYFLKLQAEGNTASKVYKLIQLE
ncbi:MAG: T9SS type A sorting domain-containing protein [Chitinophagales bacterium]|nr:T9SS type A sorting domain-containing protein [Chitinophagales bacterium]